MPYNSFDQYPMSWKPSRPDGDQPMFLAIAQQLERDVQNGVLLPGMKLPPQRELADFLDVSISTIVRSFRICTQKGLLGATVGRGTFVSYDALASLNMIPVSETFQMVELGSVMPEENNYEEIIELLKTMTMEPESGRLFGYGTLEPSAWQREAAVKLIARTGCVTSAKHILPANGGQNAIAAILAGLFQAGDRIGTDPLTYPGLKSTAKMLGIQLVPIGQEKGEISKEGLLYAIKNERIKGLYLMPSYQNPTTHVMTLQTRKQIAKIASEYEILIIEDGIHNLLCKKPLPAVANYAPEQTIYIASLSKTVSPGLRLSYISVPETYHNRLSDALYNLNLTISPFLLELSSRVMASQKAIQLTSVHRQEAVARNKIVDQLFSDYPVKGAAECIFRWLLLPQGWSSEAFEREAGALGVRLYGAHRFAVGKAKPEAAVRLAITAPRQTADLERALNILQNLLKEAPSK